ncbi:MAG: methylmalonyl-CoA mutase family protein, partial [Myxococcota bacterium]
SAPPPWPPPGTAPYVRGADQVPAASRSLLAFAQANPETVAAHLQTVRAAGGDGAFFRLSPRARGLEREGRGLPLAGLRRLLEEETARDGTWGFDAGGNAPALLTALPDRLENVHLGGDPVGAQLRDGLDVERAATAERTLARLAADLDGTSRRAGVIDTTPVHEAGADVVLELSFLTAALVHRLRAADAAGVGPEVVARQTLLRLAVDSDVFLGIAALRAARGLWTEICDASGIPPTPPRIHAVSSPRSLSRHDPWLNMLRVTNQAFAAVAGGADFVTAACFDEAVGEPDALGYRVARNTMNVLRDEAHLGWVLDPAGGSHYVETLTESLIDRAYARFQAVERAGGITAYIASGALHRDVDDAWTERRQRLVRRRPPRVGVSAFARPDEPPLTRAPWPAETPPTTAAASGLPSRRDDVPFEALRRSDHAPVFLANLGPLARHNARATFAADFFGVAGIATIGGDGTGDLAPAAAAAAIGDAFRTAGTRVACLCGDDDLYLSHGLDVVAALAAADATRIYFAGRPPGQMEGSLRDVGVDDFIFVGADVVATLEPMAAAKEAPHP